MTTCFISAKSESVRVFDSPTLILTMRVVMIMNHDMMMVRVMMILVKMMVMVMGMKHCPLLYQSMIEIAMFQENEDKDDRDEDDDSDDDDDEVDSSL